MKAITIKQPWATLIALGEKRFETRGWQTKYRGELAIHAGKQVDRDACLEPEIKAALVRNGILSISMLPTGSVIATTILKDCIRSAETWTDGYILENGERVYSPEYDFGDFTPGRYAWDLRDVKQLPEPVPAKGQLSLWNWEGGSSYE
ncbi:ASCH domain-containing protein [Paenibacillus sp. IHBB 3054]|uniref:ASCH domain-containing protein n=1 Tax=Paenibacillus sp. IHBB 3054 TaxID=3425689 RepID=UPI003F681F67